MANEVKARIKDELANGEYRDPREREDDDDFGVSSSRVGLGGSSSGRVDPGSRKRKQPRGITGLGTMGFSSSSGSSGGGGGGGGGGMMDLDNPEM
jgi:hypothetical protein